MSDGKKGLVTKISRKFKTLIPFGKSTEQTEKTQQNKGLLFAHCNLPEKLQKQTQVLYDGSAVTPTMLQKGSDHAHLPQEDFDQKQ